MKEWKNKVKKRRPGGSGVFITLETWLRTIFRIISGFSTQAKKACAGEIKDFLLLPVAVHAVA